MTSLTNWLGLTEATESELHQKLEDSGTLAAVQAKANDEAVKAVETKMADFQTQLDALQLQFADAKADNEAKAIEITALQESVADLTTKAAEKDTLIIKQAAEIKTLSGELAAFKAGAPVVTAVQPPDGGLPISDNPERKNNANTVTNEQLAAMFN